MWTHATRWLLDLLWPSACCGCRAPSGPALFCEACLGTLVSGARVSCPHCGRLSIGEEFRPGGHLCGGCLSDPPPWTRARGAFGYGGLLREVISRWKNAPDHRLGPALGRLMVEDSETLGWSALSRDTLVVPVPAHPSTIRRRGFHPAGILASAMARSIGLEIAFEALSVRRPISSSRGASRVARRRRLQGAFRPHSALLEGRSVLLIDDVMTTGATARAATEACLRGGAIGVEVAGLARTPDNGIEPPAVVGSATLGLRGGS